MFLFLISPKNDISRLLDFEIDFDALVLHKCVSYQKTLATGLITKMLRPCLL